MSDIADDHSSLVILMPVYEDRDNTIQLFAELAERIGTSAHIVAVEDGSAVNPLRVSDISDAGLKGEIVFLARNVDHQRAIAAGLTHIARHIQFDAVVIMDCDGEDKPEYVRPLLQRLNNNVDVVFAKRGKRSESLLFRIFYMIYQNFFRLLTGREIQFGNFAVMSERAVRRLVVMQESWVHIAAAIMISRLNISSMPTDRGERYIGNSKMNFQSLVLHGMRSVMVFAEDVLLRTGLLCAALAIMTVIGLAIATGLKLMGFATPGWFTTAAGLLIVIFIQTGILTLITMMISGVLRGAPPNSNVDFEQPHFGGATNLCGITRQEWGPQQPL